MKRREESVMRKTVIKLMFLKKKCTCVSLNISVFVVCRHFGAKKKKSCRKCNRGKPIGTASTLNIIMKSKQQTGLFIGHGFKGQIWAAHSSCSM